jgi:beta-aspartyl-peptidase (threonine type)
LRAQARAWNAGDLDQFMRGYWNSDDLTFSAGGRTTRGWQATYDRYRKRYPDGQAMGKLAFSDLEIVMLGECAAFVLGRWDLTPSTGLSRSGNFTLLFRYLDGQWCIVHDHTSVLAQAEE